MTKEEIIAIFEENGIEIYEFAYGDSVNPIPGIGKWVEVDQYGGEGKGEDWWAVFHFKEPDIYVKIDGYYTSYDGTNFDGGFEDCMKIVSPRQKTITVYE
jgi:hypothetical protein